MYTTRSGSDSQMKRNNSLQPMHLAAELFKKRKKLLKEKTTFAEEEGNMWENSKTILAQNIDQEENLKQSQQACKEISKQLDCNDKGLKLVEMRFKTASELIKTIMDTVRMTSKISGINIEAFTARFQALKIRAENDWEAMQEKLRQSAKIDDALLELENGLNHLLRHRILEERVERLRKMRDSREQLLRMEQEELLNRVALLKSNLEMKNSANKNLQQQADEAQAELENMLSSEIEDLDEVVIEEKELQKQLHAYSLEHDEAVAELSKLEEENEKILDEEGMLDEKVIISKTELENLTPVGRDDPKIISVRHKSVCENLQANMNESLKNLENEIKRAQTELNFSENELSSLLVFLGNGEHEWSKKIEDAIVTGRHLEEMTTAERKASASLRNKRMEIDIECNRLEMETNVLRQSNDAEMVQCKTENGNLQKFLEKLITEMKEETKRFELIRGRAAPKYPYSRDGMVEVHSAWNHTVYSPETFDFGEVSSADDFKQDTALRSQRFAATDDMTTPLLDKGNFKSGMLRIAMKFEGGRVAEPERAGKVPSDIHISRVEKGASAEVTKADANLGNHYPHPPSAFGSPLSTNESPDVATDCNCSGSDLDQSVWSDFSSVVK